MLVTLYDAAYDVIPPNLPAISQWYLKIIHFVLQAALKHAVSTKEAPFAPYLIFSRISLDDISLLQQERSETKWDSSFNRSRLSLRSMKC